MKVLSKDEERAIQECIDNAREDGSKYPGMSYEDGMEAVLMLLYGENSVEDIT